MKVVAYLRVSTDRQAEKGNGLPVQERGIRDWAKTHKHRIVDWHRDEGVSGSNGLQHRVALPDALEALRSGRAGGLVVWRLDRLTTDLIAQEHLLGEIRRLGAEPFSTRPAEEGVMADDPDDPARRLIRHLLGAVAEYETAMIAVRMRQGRP